jgi:hypothetical protein
MTSMDPLAFLLAHNATRTAVSGSEPWDPTPRRRRRPANRAERIR